MGGNHDASPHGAAAMRLCVAAAPAFRATYGAIRDGAAASRCRRRPCQRLRQFPRESGNAATRAAIWISRTMSVRVIIAAPGPATANRSTPCDRQRRAKRTWYPTWGFRVVRLAAPMPLQGAANAFKFANLPFDKSAEFFTAIIRCTCADRADSKTISKWARALQYVAHCKVPRTRLKMFMKKAGRVNACADRYAKYLGRIR